MDWRHYVDLVLVLTKKEIKVRYKNHALGYLWSIANPLAFAFVFYVAFKLVMRIKMENYAVFLVVGMFPWQWFSNSVNISPSGFVGNASIIKKTKFPRSVVVLALVLQDMIHFILSLPVIALFLFLFDSSPSRSWIYGVPLLLLVQLCTTYGTALTVATVNLFFRDMEKLTNVLVMLLFYFTPVLYSESMIPAKLRSLVYLNPVAPMIMSWRNLLLNGDLHFTQLSLAIAYALAVFLVGQYVYRRLSWRFAEVL